MRDGQDIENLLDEIRQCRICEEHLILGPRPIVRAEPTAQLLIIGQAPGTRVHESGIPWDDPSGDRLRAWLDVDREAFYDGGRIAIMPMGFCYPGVAKNGGDAPPRPECAPTWHEKILEHLPNLKLTMLVGGYAQAYYLKGRRQKTMTETVRNWRDYLPDFLVTPHPSWRNTSWLKKNPWFEAEVVPYLRRSIQDVAD